MENNVYLPLLLKQTREKPYTVWEIIKNNIEQLDRKDILELIFCTATQILSNNDRQLWKKLRPGFIKYINDNMGVQTSLNFLSRIELARGIRPLKVALYDHTIHLIGGGEKYGLTLINALPRDIDITIIANKPVTLDDFSKWYGLELNHCKIEVVPLPFFDKEESNLIDPAKVDLRVDNPFHTISRISSNYDIFINNSMNEMVFPLSPLSVLICHFPERRPQSYFYADKYNYIVYNSKYTAGWIQKKWHLTPHEHIYPPVDMQTSSLKGRKENLILSVARFEIGGSKKQLEMIQTFQKLNRIDLAFFKKWRLVLVGGSPDSNPYLDKIKDILAKANLNNIEIKVNISGDELSQLYQKAKLFWHICGLNQTDPSLVEHFGMTIVEAMQNYIAPIVFDGGGQREIIDHGVNGYRIQSLSDLIRFTSDLAHNPARIKKFGIQAQKKSLLFTRERFEETVRDFYNRIVTDYISV